MWEGMPPRIYKWQKWQRSRQTPGCSSGESQSSWCSHWERGRTQTQTKLEQHTYKNINQCWWHARVIL